MSRSSKKESAPQANHPPQCVCCALGPSGRQKMLDQKIKDDGFMVTWIHDASPPFAYSTGMTETYGLPEFVIVGRFSELFGSIAGAVSDRAKAGTLSGATEIVGLLEVSGLGGKTVAGNFGYKPLNALHLGPDSPFLLGTTLGRYGPGGFKACQIVVPDPANRLPWHTGFCKKWADRAGQPALYD